MFFSILSVFQEISSLPNLLDLLRCQAPSEKKRKVFLNFIAMEQIFPRTTDR